MTTQKETTLPDDNLEEITEETASETTQHFTTSEKSPDLNAELEQLREENASLKDSCLRAYAEVENAKKRCQAEMEKNAKFALSSFAKELLPVADNLHRAITSAHEDHKEHFKALLDGVKMTQKELTKVFNKFGIRKVDSLDKIFDPNIERVVQEVEDAQKPAGTVVAELQSAYLINDRILREAMVIVTKGGEK
ncbi:MAG: nucleotide exchange factor GrpE [Alphaproteobacteria bacterium]|nr:nucleotide exchange factor GrpE [Alphaproteobacteria bacterium]